jgi:hypothetical protein
MLLSLEFLDYLFYYPKSQESRDNMLGKFYCTAGLAFVFV